MAKNKDISKTSNIEIPNGYLTLKEASERTTYTPDYIGQLIRAGKIEGKQIYSTVLWVANESSLKAYMENKGKESQLAAPSLHIPHVLRPLLYVVIAVSTLILLFLFHILSVTIDHALARATLDEGTTVLEVTSTGDVIDHSRDGP